MITAVTQIEKDIPLARHERLGFVTFSPEKLGNTIRVSIRLKLEKLPQKQEKFECLTDKLGLRISKSAENDECNIYEVSSKKRLGMTEFETVKGFADDIAALIEAENEL